MSDKDCPHCGGEGWYPGTGTESVHHPQCDGYTCHHLCPIPVPVEIQIECECSSIDSKKKEQK